MAVVKKGRVFTFWQTLSPKFEHLPATDHGIGSLRVIKRSASSADSSCLNHDDGISLLLFSYPFPVSLFHDEDDACHRRII